MSTQLYANCSVGSHCLIRIGMYVSPRQRIKKNTIRYHHCSQQWLNGPMFNLSATLGCLLLPLCKRMTIANESCSGDRINLNLLLQHVVYPQQSSGAENTFGPTLVFMNCCEGSLYDMYEEELTFYGCHLILDQSTDSISKVDEWSVCCDCPLWPMLTPSVTLVYLQS